MEQEPTQHLHSQQDSTHSIHRPVNFLYAALIITLIGGGASVWLLKEVKNESHAVQIAEQEQLRDSGKEDIRSLVTKADTLYEAGDQKGARNLYEKAVALGSAEAHFNIAYKYIVSDQESVLHFSEAAKMGYKPALMYVLDGLFFRANSISKSNPQEALDVYLAGKAKNPLMSDFGYSTEDDFIKPLKEAIEVGPIDLQSFVETYKLSKDEQIHLIDSNQPYAVWQIAEEVSIQGRFGKPDPKRTLQFIAYGCDVPLECTSAINDFYDYWKKGEVKEFDICNYVVGNSGIEFCKYRK